MNLFLQPLRDQIAKEGQRVELEVTFQGRPEPIIKWFHEETEIVTSAEFEITYSSERTTLTIKEAILDDSGKYTCVLTNAVGSAKSEAKVDVGKSFS